jgi:insertion element IS1016 transposase
LVNVNKNTSTYYFYRLHLLIYQTISHLGMFDGEIETDESYFGGARKGNLGISDVGKAAIF